MNLFRKIFGEASPADSADSSVAAPPGLRELSPEARKIQEAIEPYAWYHEIEVAPGVTTPPDLPELRVIWRFIEKCMGQIDFQGKRVLDIGCRDGLFSFAAERGGAAEVLAIDNNLSRGLTEFLIPHFSSKVETEELNLYDLDASRHGNQDVIMFFGVLYHLRYPFWGLKKIVDCLKDDGLLLIESGMLEDTKQTKGTELLYCPVENSPYEATSCTFFNARGLITTMDSFGLALERHEVLEEGKCPSKNNDAWVSRQYFQFRRKGLKTRDIGRNIYWDKTHQYHTDEVKNKPRD